MIKKKIINGLKIYFVFNDGYIASSPIFLNDKLVTSLSFWQSKNKIGYFDNQFYSVVSSEFNIKFINRISEDLNADNDRAMN